MPLKDEWKKTGKGLGSAFADLGKNIGRSAKAGLDAVAGDDAPADETGEKSTVFNDGSWRKTGKELGGAFAGLGKSILHSVQQGVDALDKLDEDRTAGEAQAPAENDNSENNE